jgi:hypothetical protein
VDVKFRSLDVYNLSVNPFVFGILNIYVLPQVELEIISLAMHAPAKKIIILITSLLF